MHSFANLNTANLEATLKANYTAIKNQKEAQAQALLAEAGQLLESLTQNFPIYSAKVDKLKTFWQTHCEDYPSSLNFLYEPNNYEIMLQLSYKRNFANLLQSLVSLSETIATTQPNSPVFELLRTALIKGVILTNHFLIETSVMHENQFHYYDEHRNQRMYNWIAHTNHLNQKMAALAANMHAANEFAKDPLNQKKSHALYKATDDMIHIIDPAANAHEHMMYYSFINAMMFLAGISLFAVSMLSGLPFVTSPAAYFFIDLGALACSMFALASQGQIKDITPQQTIALRLSSSLKAISDNPNPSTGCFGAFFSSKPKVEPLIERDNSNASGISFSNSSSSSSG